MALPHIHILLGIIIGLISRGHPAGYALALWLHIPLDDLNVEKASWYHGWGKGWYKVLYGIFIIGTSMALCYWLLRYRRDLIHYVVAANLPDFEHIIRFLLKKPGYWIHGEKVMFHPVLRTHWGIVAWVIISLIGIASIWSHLTGA